MRKLLLFLFKAWVTAAAIAAVTVQLHEAPGWFVSCTFLPLAIAAAASLHNALTETREE